MWERINSIDQGKAVQWLARLLCLLLAALIIWQAVRIVWLLVPGQEPATHVPARPLGTVPVRDAQTIAQWHLFGSSMMGRRAAAGADTPATTLSFILRGTLADADPRAGVAVIDDGQGHERAWRVGEHMAASVALAEVHADHVVLMHDGQHEVLRMPRASVAQAAADRHGDPAASHVAPAIDLPQAAVTASLDWQQLTRASADPSSLMQGAGLVPVFEDGRMTGVRAGEHADAALLEQLGLRSTDVVTAVNGVALDSPARAPQLMQTLTQSNSARLTLLRDGATTQITVTLK